MKSIGIRTTVLLALLLLIVSLLPGSVGAQEPTPKRRWLTFTEPSFGFQIEYPEGWYPRLVADNATRAHNYGEHVAMRSIGFFGPHSQIVFVDVWVNRSRLPLREWVERYPLPSDSESIISQRATTHIADTLAFQTAGALADDRSGIPRHYNTRFIHDDLVFNVEYAALEPDITIYEHMLASFEFVQPTFSRTDVSTLSFSLPPAELGAIIASSTCCGITDPEYNPFWCNPTGEGNCTNPPCGNCVWWPRYRRRGNNEANLYRCTGYAWKWAGCAQTWYPHLVSSLPAQDAVIAYTVGNHVAYVETMYDGSSYRGSQMGWSMPCPEHYFDGPVNASRVYIHHPDTQRPNQPPNPPLLQSPGSGSWIGSRTVTLSWHDGGDPDNQPHNYRDFYTEVWKSGWSATYGWKTNTSGASHKFLG